MSEQKFISIGKIVGTFGLKGYLKVQAFTDFVERFSPKSSIWIDGESRTIVEAFWHKSQVRILLNDVSTIDEAEAYIGKSVGVPVADRPHLDKDEYYIQDLLGFRVFDMHGNDLGVIQSIHDNPAHSLIQVRGIDVEDRYIPAIKQFIKKIDMEKKYIRIRLIEGM